MTRFQLLENLATIQKDRLGPVRIISIQNFTRQWSKSAADSMRVQLNRMYKWGLVSRRRLVWRRGFSYQISMKGRARLAWARKHGLI
jgi:hypothetical protein